MLIIKLCKCSNFISIFIGYQKIEKKCNILHFFLLQQDDCSHLIRDTYTARSICKRAGTPVDHMRIFCQIMLKFTSVFFATLSSKVYMLINSVGILFGRFPYIYLFFKINAKKLDNEYFVDTFILLNWSI